MSTTQKGYLLLADISGYTSYVASTELTHSQEISSELLELIVSRFRAMNISPSPACPKTLQLCCE